MRKAAAAQVRKDGGRSRASLGDGSEAAQSVARPVVNDDRKPAIASSISRKRARFLKEPVSGDKSDEATTAHFKAVIASKLRK